MPKFDVQRELKKWKDKAIYDVRFKDDTKANLSRLDDIFMMSMEHFMTVAANTEPVVYKVARYWIEKGIAKAEDFVFLEGDVLAAHIGDDAAEWKQKDRLDELFQMMRAEYRNKWILIPSMEFEISVAMSIYLMSQFRKVEAAGLVVCAQGNNFLTQVMVQKVRDPWFVQFPEAKYNAGRRRLVTDEW